MQHIPFPSNVEKGWCTLPQPAACLQLQSCSHALNCKTNAHTCSNGEHKFNGHPFADTKKTTRGRLFNNACMLQVADKLIPKLPNVTNLCLTYQLRLFGVHVHVCHTDPARSTRCSLDFLIVSEPGSREEMWMVKIQWDRVDAMFIGVCRKMRKDINLSSSRSPPPSLSLSLSLSLSHLHMRTHTHIHTRTHTPYMKIPTAHLPQLNLEETKQCLFRHT